VTQIKGLESEEGKRKIARGPRIVAQKRQGQALAEGRNAFRGKAELGKERLWSHLGKFIVKVDVRGGEMELQHLVAKVKEKRGGTRSTPKPQKGGSATLKSISLVAGRRSERFGKENNRVSVVGRSRIPNSISR